MSTPSLLTLEVLHHYNRRELQLTLKREEVVKWAASQQPIVILKANSKNTDMITVLETFIQHQLQEQISSNEPMIVDEEKEITLSVVPSCTSTVNATPKIVPSRTATPAAVNVVTTTPVAAINAVTVTPVAAVMSTAAVSPITPTLPVADDFPMLDEVEVASELIAEPDPSEAEEAALQAEIAALENKIEQEEKKETKKADKMKNGAKSSASIKKNASIKKVNVVVTAAPPMFTRKVDNKAVAKKKVTTVMKKAAAGGTEATVNFPPSSPPSNSFASAFSLPAVFPSSSSDVGAQQSPATISLSSAAAAATGGGNDAYWSLMAELDKRVVESTKNTAPSAGSFVAAAVASIAGATAQTKKTVSRFDSAHAKVAEKSESILDYQQRLDEKKRAAAAMNAPTLGKRANSKTQSNASTIPASNKKQKTVAASQSTIAPIASPTSTAFTFAADAPAGALLFTPGVIRMSPSFSPSITMNVAVDSTTVVPSRTRLSVRKESEKMVAQEITNQVKQKIAVGVAQQQKMKSNTNNATAVVKKPVTLFAANKIPRVAMLASNSIAAPAVKPSTSSTTFTQIAGLEDVRTAASTINRTKFDLSASLAKPLTWKPYKGKVNAAVKNEAAPSENTPMDVEATTAAITQPFVFTATSSASAGSLTARALPLSSSSSKLNIVAGSSTARVGMKSSQVGVQKSNVVMKEMRREKFQQSSLQARNKATSVAREKSLLSSIPAPIPPIVM